MWFYFLSISLTYILTVWYFQKGFNGVNVQWCWQGYRLHGNFPCNFQNMQARLLLHSCMAIWLEKLWRKSPFATTWFLEISQEIIFLVPDLWNSKRSSAKNLEIQIIIFPSLKVCDVWISSKEGQKFTNFHIKAVFKVISGSEICLNTKHR